MDNRPNPFAQRPTQPTQFGQPTSGAMPTFGQPKELPPGRWPALHQLEGRLILARPFKITDEPNMNREIVPHVYADVIFLDGEPITGKVDGRNGVHTPFDEGPLHAGDIIPGMKLNQFRIVKAMEDYVATRGWVLFRLSKVNGPNGLMWSTDPFTPEDGALATQWFQTHPQAWQGRV